MESEGIEDLAQQVEALDASLGQAAGMAAAFDGELRRMRGALSETGKDVQVLEKGLSRGLRRALDGVVFDGMKLSEALSTVAKSMVNTAYSAAVRPVTDHFGGLMAQGVGALVQGMLPFANGAGFAQGRVMPFAQGGVVSGPTLFPMRGGTGLMGEAGPEAIMPLARGADGRLGVRSDGGAPVQVVMHIQTPDVEGFRRSQSQVAAQMSRALSRGQRNR
ncbi:phage tail tape measure protein [Pseudooceanicola nanhaiensis]|uniref:phage tail tape measure protein n=1 Tax=Pseudooceanicola nanhaiensis TaxID=375761 RepID=UPI001CD32956|nr:phage tail tape measure protein [Pseudooceanicola nanhaiensis]MCA0922912.1 phage tail tape measure protein [Pseudooceanicola nanhaiensis]